jgi:hypothetical protein
VTVPCELTFTHHFEVADREQSGFVAIELPEGAVLVQTPGGLEDAFVPDVAPEGPVERAIVTLAGA